MTKKTKTKAPDQLVPSTHDGAVFTVRLDQLVFKYKTREENPNKMSDELFEILKESIRTEGFLQPVLTRPLGDEMFEVLDGHHRSLAAAEVGRTEITAVSKTASSPKALALSIGMNKIRGELEYGQVADVLRELTEQTDWSHEQISLLTGFSTAEIEALVEDAQPEADELLEDVAEAPGDDEDETELPDKPFLLEITFSSRDDLRQVKRRLRKAAGKGNDLSVGLMNALGMTQDSEET